MKQVKFNCDICQKIYTRRGNLNYHKKTVHQNMKVKCNICFKEFTQQSNLNRHKKIHVEKPNHYCPSCGKGFHRKDKYNEHIESQAMNPSMEGVLYQKPRSLQTRKKSKKVGILISISMKSGRQRQKGIDLLMII